VYEKWEYIKQKHPNSWVVLINTSFEDHHHMHLLGGEIFHVAKTQDEMYDAIPDDSENYFVCRYTEEEAEEDGLLKSGF